MGIVLSSRVGKDVLGVRFVGDMQEQKSAYQNATRYNFLPIGLNCHLVLYNYEMIEKSESYKLLVNKLNNIGEFKPLCDIEASVISEFLKEYPAESFFMNSERTDKRVSAALIKDGTILGVMYASSFGDKTVAHAYAFISDKIKYEIAVPGLFSYCISIAIDTYGKDTKLIFTPSYENGYLGVIKILGEPLEECLITEYYTICESEEKLTQLRKKMEEYNQGKENEFSKKYAGYFEMEESNWITAAAASRIPYLDDLSFMPVKQQKQYTEFLRERLLQWEYNIDYEIDRILHTSMRKKQKIDLIKIDYFENDECKKIYDSYITNGEIPNISSKLYSLSEIEYYLADDMADGIFDLIPEHLKPEIYNKDYSIVCATNPDKEIVGISMLCEDNYYKGLGVLEFIYLIGPYQNIEYANDLIYHSMVVAKELRLDYFYVRNVLNVQEERFADADEEQEQYLLLYDMVQIKRYFNKKEYSNIVSVDNPFSVFAARANLIHEEEGLIFFSENYDLDMQMFAVYGDELMGTLCAKRITEEELAIFDCWISDNNKDDLLFEKMVSALIDKAERFMPEDSMIFIWTDRKEVVTKYRRIFGEERSLLDYSEQVYFLDNHHKYIDGKNVNDNLPEDVNIITGFIEKLKIDRDKKDMDRRLVVRDAMLMNSIPGLFNKEIINKIYK